MSDAKYRRPRIGIICLVFLAALARPALSLAESDDDLLRTGERLFSACHTCHTTEEGGANKIGPNLFGVFGSKAGGKPDYNYSSALKNSGITWSAQTLDEWLAKPGAFLPGTKMAFAGVPNEADRKALIAYLMEETGG